MRTLLVAVAAFLLLASTSFAGDFDKAVMLNRHGLQADAKRELIDLIFDKGASDADKAKAYYLLGTIAFEANSVSVALETWSELIERLPKSPEAAKAKDLVKGLADVFGEKKSEVLSNTVASSYLGHADFWSRGKDEVFHIDSSWLDHVDAAIKWYDKVIAEFPKSRAAELAFVGKLRTILGWREPGQYGGSYGLMAGAAARAQYLPLLLETFDAFEKAFPEAASLQAFRFQIAQVYWRAKDWDKAAEWLKTIVEKGGESSFYVDLAKRRLEKLKY